MSGILVASLMGRMGNQTMQWLFAYAFAQKYGREFQCEEWIGERIFDLPKYARPVSRDFKRVSELDIFGRPFGPSQNENLEFRGYAQTQAAMIYSKREAQSWLKLRPEIEEVCRKHRPDGERIVAHIRRGDYTGYGFVVVSAASCIQACDEFGLNSRAMSMLTEEFPTAHDGLPDDLSFMPDFYRMMTAPTLLRGNSSFSWLAALLGNGLVLSPVIDGLEGGKEHHCRFVAGNWPRFANLDFTTDLHVREI